MYRVNGKIFKEKHTAPNPTRETVFLFVENSEQTPTLWFVYRVGLGEKDIIIYYVFCGIGSEHGYDIYINIHYILL